MIQVSDTNAFLLSTGSFYFTAYNEAKKKLDIAIARCDELVAERQREDKKRITEDDVVRDRMRAV